MSWDEDRAPGFGTLADNVLGYVDLTGQLREEQLGVVTSVEELSIETPIEVEIRVGPDRRVAITCAPPLYRVAVTVEPTFHVLRLRAVAVGGER